MKFSSRSLRRRLYFLRPKLILQLVVTTSVVFGIAGLAMSDLETVYFYGFAVVGGVGSWLLVRRFVPTDREMDQWFMEDIEAIKIKAIAKTGLEGYVEPEEIKIILGPALEPGLGLRADEIQWKRGADKTYRFSGYRVLALLLTERCLSTYSCVINTLNDLRFYIQAQEFDYRAVVGVSVTENAEVFDGDIQKKYTLASGKEFFPTQIFMLSFTSGQNIEIPVTVRGPRDRVRDLPMTDLDRTVQTVRTMLRERRTA